MGVGCTSVSAPEEHWFDQPFLLLSHPHINLPSITSSNPAPYYLFITSPPTHPHYKNSIKIGWFADPSSRHPFPNLQNGLVHSWKTYISLPGNPNIKNSVGTNLQWSPIARCVPSRHDMWNCGPRLLISPVHLELLSQVYNGQFSWEAILLAQMRKSSFGSCSPHNGIGQILLKIGSACIFQHGENFLKYFCKSRWN